MKIALLVAFVAARLVAHPIDFSRIAHGVQPVTITRAHRAPTARSGADLERALFGRPSFTRH